MDFFTVAKELGMGGVLFVAFIAVATLGLTQLCKVVIRTVIRKRRRALGLIDVKGADEQDVEEFGGLAVIGLSLVIGGILGGWMLQALAVKLAIDLPRPFGGVLLGVVLAGIVSGYVNYKQSQALKAGGSGGNVDVLAEALELVQARQPVAYSNPLPVPAQGEVRYAPQSGYGSPLDDSDLRIPTPEERSRMTGDSWPATQATENPNWRP